MDRETYEITLQALGESTEAYAEIRQQPEIVAETPKALLIAADCGVITSKQVWLPKSQCRSISRNGGRSLCVKRSFLASKRLWWLVN